MKKVVFIFTFPLFLLASCQSRDIQKLNDSIAHANIELSEGTNKFIQKLDSVKEYNFSPLEADRLAMVALIDKNLKMVEGIDAGMPGGQDFKNAFLDYYKLEKDVYESEYGKICQIRGGDSAYQKLQETRASMKDKMNKENQLEKNIHLEQESFARKNNLKLQQ